MKKLHKKIKIELFKNYNKQKINSVDEVNLSKFIVSFQENNNFLIKIAQSSFTSNLSKNENSSYSFLKRKKNHFRIPKYQTIFRNNQYSISEVERIHGKKGNLFNFKKFFYSNSKTIKNIKICSIEKYLNILSKNFNKIFLININKEFSEEFKEDKNKVLNLFPKQKVKIGFSHGDFVHWNTIKSYNGKYMCFDLEYFSKERIYIYDLINWFIVPLKKYIFVFLDLKINLNFFLVLILKLILLNLKINLSIKSIEKYLLLFYLEQKYFYKMTSKLKKKYKIYKYKNIYESRKYAKYYSILFKSLIKK